MCYGDRKQKISNINQWTEFVRKELIEIIKKFPSCTRIGFDGCVLIVSYYNKNKTKLSYFICYANKFNTDLELEAENEQFLLEDESLYTKLDFVHVCLVTGDILSSKKGFPFLEPNTKIGNVYNPSSIDIIYQFITGDKNIRNKRDLVTKKYCLI